MELHDNMRVMRVLAPAAAGTTGTGRTGKIIDRQGYGGVEFVASYGTVTATNATNTLTILEGDVTGTMTSVADTDLLGTELLASLAVAATRTSDVSKNVSKRVGYKGLKRYVTAKLVPTVSAAMLDSVEAILFNPSLVPTSNP